MKQMNLKHTAPTKPVVEVSQTVILYHGSPTQFFTPTYGFGSDEHDYGKGFYLTPHKELAKEWAVGTWRNDGWVHTYEFDATGLTSYNFDLPIMELPVLGDILPQYRELYLYVVWMATLLEHRGARDKRRPSYYDARDFANTYGICCENYDFLIGYRADDSYMDIALEFAEDNIDLYWLPELLKLGDLGDQYCLKSELAFSRLREIEDPELTLFSEWGPKHDVRDSQFKLDISEYMVRRRMNDSRARNTIRVFLDAAK